MSRLSRGPSSTRRASPRTRCCRPSSSRTWPHGRWWRRSRRLGGASRGDLKRRPSLAQVLVRFGLWEELLSLPLPEDAQLYLSRTLFLRFGRALAFGAKGDVAAGRAEQAAFAALLTPMEPETRASAGRRGRIGRSPDPSRTCPPQDTRRKHNTTVAEHSGPIAAAVLEAELSCGEGRLKGTRGEAADGLV